MAANYIKVKFLFKEGLQRLKIWQHSIFKFLGGEVMTARQYLCEYEIVNMARAWDKEKSESPIGIEPMTSRTPGGRSIH